MSVYEQDECNFGSKFEPQDIGIIAVEEKCLQPLPEVKSEPEEVKEDFGEVKPKCEFGIKVEDEETEPHYKLVPFAKDQVQKIMSEYKQQYDEGSFGSKFEPQDIGTIAVEEKCLQPLPEVKFEPEEVKEDFGEVKPKCEFGIKVEDEETEPHYKLVPFAKDQVQKIMYELKEQDDDCRFESKLKPQDVGLIEAEEEYLQPLVEVKFEPQEINEDFGEVKAEYDFTIKEEEEEEEEEETNPVYQQVLPCAKDQIQVLDEVIKNENSASDKIKSKIDQKFISISENFRTSSIHGTVVNVEPDRNSVIDTVTRPFSCEVCGKSFNRRGNLKTHLRFHTGDFPFSCEVCRKSFTRRSNLKAHLLTHTGDRPFSCKECEKSFIRRDGLKKHLHLHTGHRPFSCEYCGKSFIDRDGLKKHVRIHTGDLPFSCEVCGKSFNVKGILKTHLLIHTGGRPFSCEVCGKSFNQRSNLNTHLLFHTGNRPFSCELCGKAFNQKGTLKTHLLIHTGDLPFSCDVCGKSFNQRGNLKTHLLTHTGKHQFSCEVCAKYFKQKRKLEAHMSLHK